MKITHTMPADQALAELGSRFARMRKQQGHTQEKLAEAAGIGVATLRRIEDGQDSQLSSWLKLLAALEMSAAVDALIPEDFRSPMADVLATRKRRKAPPAGDAGVIWKDETA